MRETRHHSHLVARLAACEPCYRWPVEGVGFAAWQAAWHRELEELLAPWPVSCAAVPEWVELERREAYTLHRVTYWTEPGLAATAYVGIPHGIVGTVPGVLAIHGHGATGAKPVMGWEDSAAVTADMARYQYDYGHRLAGEGVVVWAPDLRGFGDRLTEKERETRKDPCDWNYFMQSLLGEWAVTSQLHDLRVALSLLGELPQVDASRLGCAGLSYGGRLTMYLAALEERVKACVVSGALNSFVERAGAYACCGYQVVPGLLRCGDVPEILGLIAPRGLALELGDDDGTCPVDSAMLQMARLRPIFEGAGAEAALKLFQFEGQHVFDGKESIPWLVDTLRS